MTEVVTKPKTTSESDDFSDNLPDESNAAFENVKTATSSSHHDSEYDTASDTGTSEGDDLHNDDDDDEVVGDDDEEVDDDDDDEEDDDDDDDEFEDDAVDENGVVLDLERQRGDGEEQDADKKKVDDDEDRSNPQYIPKRGVFYEHDDRTADEPEDTKKVSTESGDESKPEVTNQTPKKPIKNRVAADRWTHDRYDESEQAPKSRTELVNSYGYDIRNEDGPPRARRRRRYGRGPSKYTRKWEDETAYAKLQPRARSPRPEDFPELGTRNASTKLIKEEKENNGQDNTGNGNGNGSGSGGGGGGGVGGNGGVDIVTARKYNNRSPSRKINDSNRSQHQRNSDNRYDHRQHNDRHDRNNRSHNDRHHHDQDNNQMIDRYDDNQHHTDRFRHRSQQQQQSDRYEINRNERNDRNDRYDDAKNHHASDKNWDRKNNRSGGSTGFRTGKNTIEFINTNRNKPIDGQQIAGTAAPTTTTPTPTGPTAPNAPPHSGRNYNPTNPFRAQFQTYPDNNYVNEKPAAPVETVSFTNSAVIDAGNIDYAQLNRNAKDLERTERAITGRGHGSMRNNNPNVAVQQTPQPSSIPNNTIQLSGSHKSSQHNALGQIAPQSLHTQSASVLQQQQAPPQSHPISANSMMSTEAARSTKRYSSLRQRTNIDAIQQNVSAISLHEQQQMMLSDPTIMLQLQQTQESMQLQQNLNLPNPSAAYATQPIPLQLQTTDYNGQMTKPPPGAVVQQQSGQSLLLSTPPPPQQQQQQPPPPQQQQPPLPPQTNQQQTTNSPQYQTAFYTPSEFPGATATVSPPQTHPAQAPPPTAQLLTGPGPVPVPGPQQFQAQYNSPTPPYLQAPPPATYIQQQPPPPPNQQQPQILNYVPTIPPTQPPSQFQPVHQPVQPFPAYPAVPNYNTVSSGITYYAPQTQPPPSRPIHSQRRPTNAIPILAPPERSGNSSNGGGNNSSGGGGGSNNNISGKTSHRSRPHGTSAGGTGGSLEQIDKNDQQTASGAAAAVPPPIGSPENIDHILDNMFVQRAPYQPPTRKSSSPSPDTTTAGAAAGATSPSIISSSTTTEPSETLDSLAMSTATTTKLSSPPPPPQQSQPSPQQTVTSFDNNGSGTNPIDISVSKLTISDDIGNAQSQIIDKSTAAASAAIASTDFIRHAPIIAATTTTTASDEPEQIA